ncbi:ATP-binding protein [Bradyrhizobium sp. AUGA SZCCT0169]|uniref:AlbA family DNA-binding domain-containing protein n=1 Tax=Bradyrhizobium sp. AUGA SZCCT0169 TaxID=2807663 RepID=UPI001BADFC85|nr:ATP-binding protein [Bradyrhizobium sp. AUGA SZCCT0169]MBR1246131.1 ATP-binding protein [Bradyrhizobium sp. AUGA SZCCT0169]
MALDIFSSPLESLSFLDFGAVVKNQLEEGPRLEFKRSLPAPEGRDDRWMLDQKGIGNTARDDIAKEVVAFANAYGGVVIVGIEETDDNPKRAASIWEPQIPKVVDCASRLEQSLRSVIDPPLPMLEVRGVESSDGYGIIILRVGASPSAPHGHGRPVNAYVRRGTSSEPLTMRDMQSIFYERRTRLERISRIVDDQITQANTIADDWRSGHLTAPQTNEFLDNSSGLLFQLFLIGSEDFAIDNLPDLIRHERQKIPVPSFNGFVDFPTWSNEWSRGYRSISYARGYGRRLSKVEIGADGVIKILLIKADNRFHPDWFSKVIVQGLVLAEWLRRWRGRTDIEFILHGSFQKAGNPAIPSKFDGFDSLISIPWDSASIGPYSVTSRSEFPSIHDIIERELWNLFCADRENDYALNWDDISRSAGF